MLSWLQPFRKVFEKASGALERLWFVSKLALGLLILIVPPLLTFVIAQHAFKLPLPFAAGLALAVDYVLFVGAVTYYAAIKRYVVRAIAWLWSVAVVRWVVMLGAACVLFLLGASSIRHAGEQSWLYLLIEGIAVLAAFIAYALYMTPVRLRLGEKGQAVLNVCRTVFWIVLVAALDVWLYVTTKALLGGNWIFLPLGVFERFHVALALLPPAVCTLALFLAGPPYLRRAAPQWTWSVWRSKDLGTQAPHRRKPFVEIPVFDLTIGRVFFMETDPFDALSGRLRPMPGRRIHPVRLFWIGVAVMTCLSVLGLSTVAARYMAGVRGDLAVAVSYRPVVATIAYDRYGKELCRFSLENRVFIPLDRIPAHVQDAFIAIEDERFWEHDGIDPYGMLRAGYENLKSDRTMQGASTITQQVVKQVVLKNSERSWDRKTSEIFLAVELERMLRAQAFGDRRKAKRRILEVYLNHVFLGNHAYGVQAAAERYFGKTAETLTLAEAAMLAGLPKAPSRDAPHMYFERAKARQRLVLQRMRAMGIITSRELKMALNEPIGGPKKLFVSQMALAPYACEEVRRFAEETFGWSKVYQEGLFIDTTFDPEMIRKAQSVVRYGLLDLERRLGFAGPEGHDEDAKAECLGPAVAVIDQAIEANARVIARAGNVIKLCVRGNVFPLDAEDAERVHRWENAKPGRALVPGDLLTVRIETRTGPDGMPQRFALTARRTGGEAHPEALQAALVAIDQQSGEIRAIVGGYDWNESQFNNATQARRQTGSSIKPYVYLAALLHGKTAVSTELDGPICLSTATGPWCPGNYDNKYMGTVDLRMALAKSLNSVSVRLARDVGLDEILRVIRTLGVRSSIVRVWPISVGSPELTLKEQTVAYATILSNGRPLAVESQDGVPGIFVKEVRTLGRDANGEPGLEKLYGPPPRPETPVVTSGVAFELTYLMRGVIESGTATSARQLRWPVAGKTGTTNNANDVWFVGGTPALTVGVWVGRNTPTPIANKATGGSVALPFWNAFMQSVFPLAADGTPTVPPRDFPIPDDVTLTRHGETEDGRPVLIPFARGKVPHASLHAPAEDFGHGAFD